MGKMEQKVRQVTLPEKRRELILYLMNLMDEEYQLREWVQKWQLHEGPDTSFKWKISFPFEAFEDLDLFERLKEKKLPADQIGIVLKSNCEAKILYKVAQYLHSICFKCYTNEEYLTSPCLPKLRKASKKAFNIFMANEKDNKELLEFVEHVKKEQNRAW